MVQQIRRLAKTTVPGWVVLLGSLLPLAAALGATARTIRQAADARYVLHDSLVIYQQGEAAKHLADSLNLRDALKDMRQHGDSVARDLKVCIRHPEDCR